MQEATIKEMERIGSLRVRLVKNGEIKLDVREYVEAQDFTGFTRKGIRIDRAGILSLINSCREALELMDSPKPVPVVNATAQAAVRALSPMVRKPVKAAPMAATGNAQLDDLRARMRRGEVIPLTGPGSLAEAMQRPVQAAPAIGTHESAAMMDDILAATLQQG